MPKRLVYLAAAALFLLNTPPVFAGTRQVVSRSTDLDVPTLTGLARRGEVALIEVGDDGKFRQVVLFSILDAPPERVWDVLMDVEAYPKFLRTIVGSKITQKKGDQISFEWELDVPFFNLEGSRLQRGKRPSLVESRGYEGHLRGSRERWELYPIEDGKKTLAAFYRSLDIETGGILLQTMIKLEPAMEQGANLSTGFVHLRGVKRHLAGQKPSEHVAHKGPVPAFRKLALNSSELDLEKLGRLLRHGQLALIESHDDGSLKQVALLAVVNAPRARLEAIVQAPGKYPEFIPNFAKQEVKMRGEQIEMKWELEVPLTNLEGTSLMTIEADGSVDVVAVEGDIERGRWRWEFTSLDAERTIPVHYAYTDVRESSWVTKKLVDKEPLLEHGIVIASGTVALTAMKARAEGRR